MLMSKLFATPIIAAAFAFAAAWAIAADQIAQQTAPPGDSTRPTLTPEEQAKAKAEAAAKKEANSKMTPAEKKAANAAKQKALKESTKDSKQDKP
jgi:hypothetical protein